MVMLCQVYIKQSSSALGGLAGEGCTVSLTTLLAFPCRGSEIGSKKDEVICSATEWRALEVTGWVGYVGKIHIPGSHSVIHISNPVSQSIFYFFCFH